MNNTFFIHVNNHVNRKSYKKMTSTEKKKAQPSYTVAGKLINNEFHFGLAVCSKEDTFSKEKGRELALGKVGNWTYDVPKYVIDNGILGKYFVTKAKKLIKKL